MATPSIENTEESYFGRTFDSKSIKMLLTFKTSMPSLANLTFRNGRFLQIVIYGTPFSYIFNI